MKTQVKKQADLRYIVTLKDRPYIKVYIYRSSDDTKNYECTVVRGHVSSFSCPATKPCYHWNDAQDREDANLHKEQAPASEETSTKGTLNRKPEVKLEQAPSGRMVLMR